MSEEGEKALLRPAFEALAASLGELRGRVQVLEDSLVKDREARRFAARVEVLKATLPRVSLDGVESNADLKRRMGIWVEWLLGEG